MLECNLKLIGRVLSFANASKSTCKSAHGTRLCGVLQGLHNYCYILSWVSVGWSESVNIYFKSHDIRCVLYLVLLFPLKGMSPYKD